MKICVIGANGKAGKLIVEKALDKGLDVTSVVRNKANSLTDKTIVKDLFDLTKEDIKDFDVIVSAFAAWTEDKLNDHTNSIKKLCELINNTDKRLIIVGRAGSLFVDNTLSLQLKDTKDFPNEYKPVADAMSLGLE